MIKVILMEIMIDNSDVLKMTFKGAVNMSQEVVLPKEVIPHIMKALQEEGRTQIDTKDFKKGLDYVE